MQMFSAAQQNCRYFSAWRTSITNNYEVFGMSQLVKTESLHYKI